MAVTYTSLEIGLVGVAMIVTGIMLSVSRLLKEPSLSPASERVAPEPQGEGV
jgi:hypothetical protein